MVLTSGFLALSSSKLYHIALVHLLGHEGQTYNACRALRLRLTQRLYQLPSRVQG